MRDRKYTKDKPKEDEPPKIPEKSVKPSDYVRVENELYCKTCAREHVLVECACGKFGPVEHMNAHLENRHALGDKAKKRHYLVKPGTKDRLEVVKKPVEKG